MKVLSWLSFALFSIVSVSAHEEPQELKVETTFMPSECLHKARKGDQLKVHYTGTLFSNGNKFDSSLDRGQPFTLTLGAGQVIQGWDEGLQSMCLSEQRTLTIPSPMGYGPYGFGNIIPPNAGLVFTVELVGLEPSAGADEREEL
ncbi:unnamed protein product [Cyclocybe aegerita]|uniref:peptidylprolyl isomerase n=1 Tax=Cyclocybe aegerita TaxID=1973307 RepID=A0A8S0WM63_CYCAE|nr:unnamed protein product [Cyclocybe aegerita]